MPADSSTMAMYNGLFSKLPAELAESDHAMLSMVYAQNTRNAMNKGLPASFFSIAGCNSSATKVGTASRI